MNKAINAVKFVQNIILFGGARAGGDLYGEVQYIMSNGHIWTDRQTWLKTLPSLNFVGGNGNGNIWLKQEFIN